QVVPSVGVRRGLIGSIYGISSVSARLNPVEPSSTFKVQRLKAKGYRVFRPKTLFWGAFFSDLPRYRGVGPCGESLSSGCCWRRAPGGRRSWLRLIVTRPVAPVAGSPT